MGRYKTIILKFLFGLSVGIIPSLWLLQHNQLILNKILEKIIVPLELKWNVKITHKYAYLNIWNGSIIVREVQVQPNYGNYSCKIKTVRFQFYKIYSLINKKINSEEKITINNGSIIAENQILFNDISGEISLGKNFFSTTSNFIISQLNTDAFRLHGTWNKNNKHLQISNTQKTIRLILKSKPSGINLKIKNNQHTSSGNITYKKSRLTFREKNSNFLISVSENKNHFYEFLGKIKYSFARSFLPENIKLLLLGNSGIISCKGTLEDNGIRGMISLTKSKIRIPHSYNLIHTCAANYFANWQKKQLTINNFVAKCYKGIISCPHAIQHFSDAGKLEYAYAPISITNLLINKKNNLFALVNSNLCITKQKNLPSDITGNIVIKKALIRSNILSKIKQAPNLDLDCNMHINIISEDPVAIKTILLQSKLTTDLKLQLNSNDPSPKLIGTIALHHGNLNFLRNKLHISSGSINFLENHINPSIDILAKNRIKKYMVTMHLSGTTKKPNVSFEANPELTEEQIISLLFGGSENISLQADLPALIMQHMNTFIFEPQETKRKSVSFFKNITKPLKYIQITPNFTDQSGRGGIKGTISIDINKQFHAFIQKNFTMQDDLAVQLEYFLSDDFNVKATKDSRGDIGAEVEFRFKPSRL